MKKYKLYKKKYKKQWMDNIFLASIGYLLILETNLLSGTINIPKNWLVIIAVVVIVILNLMVVISVNTLSKEIDKKVRTVSSFYSKRNIGMVKNLFFIPWIPLLFLLVSRKNESALILIAISIMLLLGFKSYIFDNVITFSTKDYTSGFSKISISKIECLHEIERIQNNVHEDIITFNIISDGKTIGYDNFYETDFSNLRKIVSEQHA